jgi:hypothetical protein
MAAQPHPLLALPAFTIAGPPRTKKTSNRIVQIRAKGGGRGFTKILPSEAHEAWFKAAMQQAPGIRAALLRAGVRLPLAGLLNVRAMFYRDRLSGDATGFYQGLADWLQEPRANKDGKTIRQGAGIIRDDAQIVSWDGSRLLKDAARPRIEVQIEVVEAGQQELGLEEEF